uniref:SUI1 domain-containing protein n=1 Tax=Ciona savignyi TaxID=51511 RepID=H2YWQ6_CIOSA
MFQKPFRTKSNTLLRNSDKKRLRKDLQESFDCNRLGSTLTEIIPNKEDVCHLKLYSHKGENVSVFFWENNPMLFDHEKTVYPTVCFLWKYPKLVPCIPTQAFVIHKLANGADLMLPGVVFHPDLKFPCFERGEVVAINTLGNYSALAVGVAVMSSNEMLKSEDKRGKAVRILHVFGDQLWTLGEKTQPPRVRYSFNTSDENTLNETEFSKTFENLKMLGNMATSETPNQDTGECKQNAEVSESTTSVNDNEVLAENNDIIEDATEESLNMDELLHVSFMTAIKSNVKDNQLPILAMSITVLHVLPCCPSGVNLEIKKTKHKKLGKYLKEVAATGLIEVKELTKGNDNIVQINRSHPDYCAFKPVKKEKPTEEINDKNTEVQFGVVTQKKYEPPEVSILYGTNAATLPLFKEIGLSKGSVLAPIDVRKLVTEYVNKNDLSNGRYVTLDPTLHHILYTKQNNHVTQETWENVFKMLTSKMQVYHQLKFKEMPPIVNKGPPPCVVITTQKRTGNKKVTLVKNLESFLIDPNEFMDVIRKTAQASTSISLLPSSKPTQPFYQVLVQGNQVHCVESILTGGLYQLPRKYLKGLENAPKPKGKRK